MSDRAWLEQPPPWVVFPGMRPLEAAADQGLQEAWVDQVWRPFWASLGAAERDAYLTHWGASEAWRTSSWPVTTSAMSRVRYSRIKSISRCA